MRLLEIRNDPIAHFLPTKVTPQGTFLCTAPAGLAPELAEMFLKPMSGRSKKRTLSPDKAPSSKRQKLDDDEVEQARREGSLAPSIGFGSELGRASMGPDGGFDFGDQSGHMEDFQLEVPPADIELGGGMNGRASVAPSERSRMSTPGFDGLDDVVESYADETCPIAMFDVKPSTQSQLADREQEAADVEGKGYSKNTIKALSVVRRELKPLEGADDEKVLGFQRMADKVMFQASAQNLSSLLARRHAVQQPHSSSNCLFSERGTASNSLKMVHSKISRFGRRTNCGTISSNTHPRAMLPPLGLPHDNHL